MLRVNLSRPRDAWWRYRPSTAADWWSAGALILAIAGIELVRRLFSVDTVRLLVLLPLLALGGYLLPRRVRRRIGRRLAPSEFLLPPAPARATGAARDREVIRQSEALYSFADELSSPLVWPQLLAVRVRLWISR